METNVNPSAIEAVLILMAAASLFAMLSLNQIGYIVHGDLYSYGLQFSYRWAMPYWTFSGVLFGLSWVNIALSTFATIYFFRKSRRESEAPNCIPKDDRIETAAELNETREQRGPWEDATSKTSTTPRPAEGEEELLKEAIKQPESPARAQTTEIPNQSQKNQPEGTPDPS